MEEEKIKTHEEKKVENKVEKEEIKKEDISNKENFTDKIRENPWIASTLVLGILCLILLTGSFGGMTGEVISENDAGEALLNFANEQGAEAELGGVKDVGDFYEVTLMVEGQDLPLMVTKDGEYFLSGGLVPLNVVQQTDSQQQESVDWSVFENELPENVKSKILSFNYEEPEVYDEELRINEFASYDLIPKTLIVFYGSSCGACKGYFPVLVEVKEKYPEIIIYALNSGQNRDFAEKYDIEYVPTTIINLKYKLVGGNSLESLSEILDKLD